MTLFNCTSLISQTFCPLKLPFAVFMHDPGSAPPKQFSSNFSYFSDYFIFQSSLNIMLLHIIPKWVLSQEHILNNCWEIFLWSIITKLKPRVVSHNVEVIFISGGCACPVVQCSKQTSKALPMKHEASHFIHKEMICLYIGHTPHHSMFSSGNTSLPPSHPLDQPSGLHSSRLTNQFGFFNSRLLS